MTIGRSGLAACLLLLFAVRAHSQEEAPPSYKFREAVSYSKAKVYLTNNARLEVRNLTIENDRLTFQAKGSPTADGKELEDVQVIKVSEGKRAGEYALYGGIVFALSSALALLQVEADPYNTGNDVEINKPLWIGGFAAGGLLLGGIVGSTQDKWKTLYVRDTSQRRDREQILVSVEPAPMGLGLGVRFGF